MSDHAGHEERGSPNARKAQREALLYKDRGGADIAGRTGQGHTMRIGNFFTTRHGN